MSFKRSIFPSRIYSGDELTSALISIGVRLAGEKLVPMPNIEDVLFSATIEAISIEDYRVLGFIVDWTEVHGRMINVDRMITIVSKSENTKVKCFWRAVGEWQSRDTRWKKVMKLAISGRIDLLEIGTDYLIEKNGEDERFSKTSLRVPNKTLRRRIEDIQAPAQLAKMHSCYRYRVIIGPSFRADIWAYLSADRKTSIAELARITYSSFATAWGARRDFDTIFDPKLVKAA